MTTNVALSNASPAQQTTTEQTAARYIAMSPAYLRQARRKGNGPAYLRIGRAIRYRIVDLDAWLDQRRVVPSSR
jgi:hypothetical protein